MTDGTIKFVFYIVLYVCGVQPVSFILFQLLHSFACCY